MFFCEGWDSLTWETALSDTAGKTDLVCVTFYPSHVRLPNPNLTFFLLLLRKLGFSVKFWTPHFNRGVLQKSCTDFWKRNTRFYELFLSYNTVLKSRRQLSVLQYNLNFMLQTFKFSRIETGWNLFLQIHSSNPWKFVTATEIWTRDVLTSGVSRADH